MAEAPPRDGEPSEGAEPRPEQPNQPKPDADEEGSPEASSPADQPGGSAAQSSQDEQRGQDAPGVTPRTGADTPDSEGPQSDAPQNAATPGAAQQEATSREGSEAPAAPAPRQPSKAGGPGQQGLKVEGAIEQLDLEKLLNEPVVTASGGAAEERALAAANVVVVSREQIQRHGWRTLGDVLSNIPGIYVTDDHVIPSVGVRGVTGGLRAGSRLVKVMINGVPVNFRPDLTAFLGSEYIPMDTVRRIEIVQGPLSALYGANAFIATVNVITRKPQGEAVNEIAGRANVVEGNPGGGGSVFISHGDEELGLTAAYTQEWINRSGLRIEQTFPGQDPRLDRFDQFFNDTNQNDKSNPMSMYMRLHVGKPTDDIGRLTVQGGVQRLDEGSEFRVNTAMSHRSRVSIINYWASARFEHRFSEKARLTADASYSRGRPTREYSLAVTEDPNVTFNPRFQSDAFYGSVKLNWKPLGERLSLRFGADAEVDVQDVLYYTETFQIPFGEREPGDQIDLIGDNEDPSRRLWDVGVGLQATSTPAPEALPGLRLTGNIRADVIEYEDISFPTQLSWRGGVIYQWSDALVTKLIGGQAFQTPSAVQMFAKPGFGRANNLVGNAEVRSLGFSELEPQTVRGAEAIISTSFEDHLVLDLSGYYQRIEDRIVFQQLATDFIAVNSESERSVGALGRLKIVYDRFSGYATGTFQRQLVDGDFIQDPPPLFPNYYGTVGANVNVPEARLRFNAHLNWTGPRGASQSNTLINNGFYELDPYATLDLTVTTHDLHLWDDKHETKITASVRNVTGTDYSEPGFTGFDVPQLNRSFWFEVRQSF